MGTMSASDAAPLPRLGEVFFDVRGNSRSMRLSWYADTGVAVLSIWQGGMCTGTFRLAIADLPRMVETLQRGPGGQRPEWDGDLPGRAPAEDQGPPLADVHAMPPPPPAGLWPRWPGTGRGPSTCPSVRRSQAGVHAVRAGGGGGTPAGPPGLAPGDYLPGRPGDRGAPADYLPGPPGDRGAPGAYLPGRRPTGPGPPTTWPPPGYQRSSGTTWATRPGTRASGRPTPRRRRGTAGPIARPGAGYADPPGAAANRGGPAGPSGPVPAGSGGIPGRAWRRASPRCLESGGPLLRVISVRGRRIPGASLLPGGWRGGLSRRRRLHYRQATSAPGDGAVAGRSAADYPAHYAGAVTDEVPPGTAGGFRSPTAACRAPGREPTRRARRALRLTPGVPAPDPQILKARSQNTWPRGRYIRVGGGIHARRGKGEYKWHRRSRSRSRVTTTQKRFPTAST